MVKYGEVIDIVNVVERILKWFLFGSIVLFFILSMIRKV